MITLLLENNIGLTTKIVEPSYKLSPHFTAGEFLINKGDNIDLACVSQYDIDTLEAIRMMHALPISITSAGRTPAYNAKIGGATESNHQHMFNCVDFVINATDEQLDDIFEYLKYRGYTGIGRYPNGRFHIDRGYRYELTVWDER